MQTIELSKPVHAAPAARGRLDWLDNLRVVLTVLVVVHHAAQPYGPADWWYVQGQPQSEALATLATVNGTFFMSLFFFVSAVFVPGSAERRGGWRFLKGRLTRLGIPLVVGALTIVPGLMYAYYVSYRGYPSISFQQYFLDVYLGLGSRPADWTGPSWPDLQFGHLWFIQNLLAYSVLYLLCRQAARLFRRKGETRRLAVVARAPGHRGLWWLVAGLAVATFVVRLWYPLDHWEPVLDFLQVEPARVPLYATFFTLGVLAHRHDWLRSFDARVGWLWLTGSLAAVALLFAVGSNARVFGTGGPDAASAVWAAYESALCVGLCVGLLTLFREAITGHGRVLRELAAGSYTVYILHLPLVVWLQYLLADWRPSAPMAWAVTSVLSVPATYLFAAALRRLPALRRVL